MNYFAHGMAFLDRPYVLAGTAVPDWLRVADRQVRLRPEQLKAWWTSAGLNNSERHGPVGQLVRGIRQHLADDHHFHRRDIFFRLWTHFSQEVSIWLDGQNPEGDSGKVVGSEDAGGWARQEAGGWYSAFVGHLLLEVLLDAVLIEKDPQRLEQYYEGLGRVDEHLIQQVVNRISSRPSHRLAPTIAEFRRLQILADYLENQKLLGRLNQVMSRVGLPRLPETFLDFLPPARQLVARHAKDLLAGIPVALSSSWEDEI